MLPELHIIALVVPLIARQPSPEDYPQHIGGRCITSFDCDPNSTSVVCVPLDTVRDCLIDCPNGADEECISGTVLCDSRLVRGCGKCVPQSQLNSQCTDRRWRRLCDEPDNFQCAYTENCVLSQWIGDGVDDCGDGSDEGTSNGCLPGEFHCASGAECVPVTSVLDGVQHCTDGSDENYCSEINVNEMCQRHELCSFNPDQAIFVCGCPFGHRRSDAGICFPLLAPVISGDCADVQRRYRNAQSDVYKLNDWKCRNVSLCTFNAHCEMQLFGGGWTVLLQRFNTSLSFERNIHDYENGFEIDEYNFWAGLERIYRLTNRPQSQTELLVRLRTARDGRIILVRYSYFFIYDKMHGYRLNLGPIIFGPDLDVINELAESQWCPFVVRSTADCPDGGSGWWRRRCLQKGVLTAPNKAIDDYSGLRWNHQRLSHVQMLIRPRGYIPPPKSRT